MRDINIISLVVGITDVINWSKVGVGFTPKLVTYTIGIWNIKWSLLPGRIMDIKIIKKTGMIMNRNLFSSDSMHCDIKIVIDGKNLFHKLSRSTDK